LPIKLLVIVLLLLGACGKKTGLVVYDDSAPEPKLTRVFSSADAQSFHLNVDIEGGSGAVLYQVDRAEVDPSCHCIAQWLRYYESTPSMQHKGLAHHFKIRKQGITYAFRVRAVDSLGRKTAWSKVMKAEAAKAKGDAAP
jgi:hypothetical protein